jgi:hypothetical protein
LPDALAVEMEGAAFAQVCHDYGVALAAVRTVSDRADDAAHGDFLTFIDQVASRHFGRDRRGLPARGLTLVVAQASDASRPSVQKDGHRAAQALRA